MKQRIFRAILAVSAAILLLSVVLISIVLYNDLETQFRDELKSEAHTVARALDSGLPAGDYLPSLSPGQIMDRRLTLVTSDGSVLYDSAANAASMENHLDREEITNALQNGSGSSERYSKTLSKKTFYYACRLQSGDVLRVSGTQSSVFGILFRALRPAVVVVALAALLLLPLASRVANLVLKPLNEMDLEHPQSVEAFEEMAPLLEKISAQNRQIHTQMEQLRHREEEFSAVTEHMSEGLLLVDRQMRLLFRNEAACRLLHIEESAGQDLLSVNRSAPFREAVETALQGRRALETLRLEGRLYQLLASPAYDGGHLTGAVLLLLDVTEREDRERLRREFTANVSHELRTPLTSISGYAELIREGLARPEDVPRFAGNICRETERLLALIEDILRLSQLDEGEAVECSPQRLDLLAERVAGQLQPGAAGRGIRLEVRAAPCEVSGVESILEELIYNLCDNAVKYNREGGSVLITVGTEDGRPALTVADTGIGIPQAEQERVFERFYRVDKSHSRAAGGTGLGLSIVKHAAAFHHADITLHSVSGEGTRITVTFPELSTK